MRGGQLALLKAVAEGKHFLYELNKAYHDAGFGLFVGWHLQNGVFVKEKPVAVNWRHMACQVALQRLCGLCGYRPEVKPLLCREKQRSPRNVEQWAYFLTPEGVKFLKEHK